ncbi:trimeric LpxA-like protein [Lipomyces oligophaga]|uniref:trimeric LpxA-like protein n=1 Tax=Lipomyces oligophaga TaxID=45792 RepID=UPI0034CDD7C1
METLLVGPSIEILEADETSFISEFILVNSKLTSKHLHIKVGRHSVLNPRVCFTLQIREHLNGTAVVSIGDYSIVSDYCQFEIISQHLLDPIVVGNYTIIDPSAKIESGVQVGDYCVIGSKAVLGHGSKVGDNCYVAAGTVLEAGMIVPEFSAVSESNATRILPVGDDFDQIHRKREMRLHIEFLMRTMPSYNKRRK